MKARRSVCKIKWARLRVVPGLGKLVLNCTRSPMKGGYFCKECRAAAAKRGPQGLVLAGGMTGGPAPAPPQQAEAPPAAAPAGAATTAEDLRAARGWAAGRSDTVEADEKNVFLVEDILEHKPGTQKALLSKNGHCMCDQTAVSARCKL